MLERRYLVLEDGTYYEGYKLGSNDLSVGEIVFNTLMTDTKRRYQTLHILVKSLHSHTH